MAALLTAKALNRALLARQLLLGKRTSGMTVTDVVRQIAGLQAQQPRAVFAGLWSRMDGVTRDDIRAAMAANTVVRALLLRGTLHLVTRDDYAAWRAVLDPVLTGAAQSVLKDRLQTFPADRVLAEATAFFQRNPATFTALRDHLVAKFPSGDERAMGYYIRTHLPLTSVFEPGEDWGYSSDAPFAPPPPPASKRSAAAAPGALLVRYLAAFGPATPADFQSWSGMKGVKPLFEANRELVQFQNENKRTLYDLPDAPRPEADTPAPVRMVAEFDNLVLAHADRARIVPEEHKANIITKNLQIPGTFLVDGFVAGTWKWDAKKRTIAVEPFGKLTKAAAKELDAERASLEAFLR